MLTLTRKTGEALLLGSDVVVRIHKVTPTRVELAIECPRGVRIVRGEAAEGWSAAPPREATAAAAG
jgi:carbon storage regulator CsrA